jgi:streptogramin lyase
MMKRVILLVLLVLFPGWLIPGGTTYKFRHIGPQHGLPHKGVFCIMQDARGFIWMATGNGLVRHDGYDFKVFKPGHRISCIYEDRQRVLWLGTGEGGLMRFDRQREQFSFQGASGEVRVIVEDSLGSLWVGTGSGLYYLDGQRRASIRYGADPADPGNLSSGSVWTVFEDRSGELWIGTGGGLNRFDRQRNQFCLYRHQPATPHSLSSDRVTAVCEDRQGTLWVGTDRGLYRFDRREETFYSYPSAGGISAVLEDRQGNLWIGTRGRGLNQLDRPAKKLIPCRGGTGDARALDTARIVNLMEDRTGILWVGTENSGVFKVIPRCKNPHKPPVVITEIRLPDGTPFKQSEDQPLRLEYVQRSFSIRFAALDYTAPEKNRYAYRLEGRDRDWIELAARRSVSFHRLAAGEYTFRVRGANNDGLWNLTGTSLKIIIPPPFWQTRWFWGLLALLVIGILITLSQSVKIRVHKSGG